MNGSVRASPRLLDYALARGEVALRLISYMAPETPMGAVVGVA